MTRTSLLVAFTAGALALAPMLAQAKGAKPAHGPELPPGVADAIGGDTATVLPARSAFLGARPQAGYNPFDVPAKRPCVTLTDPTWAKAGSATLCGLVSKFDNNIAAYPGIRYAGAARWQKPTPHQEETRDLTGFGPSCPQASDDKTLKFDEACQYLNVWVPAGASADPAGYPVMVFIYGGAFLTGSSSLGVYDGTKFAQRHVILVSLNYRLGALGFLVSKKFGLKASGNFGMWDQQKALQWVHDNIKAFGGDPNKVTIFGESAGAMSVGLHLYAIPKGNDYFRAAIMESNPVGLLYKLRGARGPSVIGGQFLTKLCYEVTKSDNAACALGMGFDPKTATMEQIMTAQADALADKVELGLNVLNGRMGLRGLPYQPVIDGDLITGQPLLGYAAGTHPKPVMFGINKDEGAVFAALVAASASSTDAKDNPTDSVYHVVVDGAFPTGNILNPGWKKLANSNVRYDPKDPNPPNYPADAPYYNRNGQSAANMVLDYDFAMGNIVMARNAHDTSKAVGGTVQPVYAYYFDQPPLVDIYGSWDAEKQTYVIRDNGACAPGIGNNVCHAAELPYVFDTWHEAVPPELHLVVPAQDDQLAQLMNEAWADFATDPTKAPKPWGAAYAYDPASADGVPAVLFHVPSGPPPPLPPVPLPLSTVALDPNAVSAIWLHWLTGKSVPSLPAHKAATAKPHG